MRDCKQADMIRVKIIYHQHSCSSNLPEESSQSGGFAHVFLSISQQEVTQKEAMS